MNQHEICELAKTLAKEKLVREIQSEEVGALISILEEELLEVIVVYIMKIQQQAIKNSHLNLALALK